MEGGGEIVISTSFISSFAALSKRGGGVKSCAEGMWFHPAARMDQHFDQGKHPVIVNAGHAGLDHGLEDLRRFNWTNELLYYSSSPRRLEIQLCGLSI